MAILFAILCFVAGSLWVGVFRGSLTLHESDPAGNGLARAFTALGAGALWILLAVLLLIAGSRGEMSTWCGISALVLVPASGVAVQVALKRLGEDRSLKWPAIVPGLVPLLLLAYAIGHFIPKTRPLASSTTVGILVWGAVALLIPLPWIAQTVRRMRW